MSKRRPGRIIPTSIKPANAPNPTPFSEIGVTGLSQWGGYIHEEILRELRGPRGMQTYREMLDNDPIVNAMVQAIETLATSVEWRVDDADDATGEGKRYAEVVHDMLFERMQWRDVLSEILTMLPYGFSLLEQVYERRPDGLLGWRRWSGRSQETIERWDFDDQERIIGAEQQPPQGGGAIYLPLSKCLLFRTQTHRNNPEGRSILRSAYRPWYFKRRIEEFEGIGIERDLAGLPTLKPPPELGAQLWNTQDATMVQMKADAEALVRNIKRDEQEGVLLPPGWELELLASGGSRQMDVGKVIQRYDERIAMSTLADFILVGHGETGSRAMLTSKVNVFTKAMSGYLQRVCDVVNRVAIRRLGRLNAWDMEQLPLLAFADPAPVDLAELGAFLSQMAAAGAPIFPNKALTEYIFKVAKLPPDDLEEAMQIQEENREMQKESMLAGMEAQAAKPKPGEKASRKPGITKRRIVFDDDLSTPDDIFKAMEEL